MRIKKAFGINDLFRLRKKYIEATVDTAMGWSSSLTGSGAISMTTSRMGITSGANASSVAKASSYLTGSNVGGLAVADRFNFAKHSLLSFVLLLGNDDANTVRYFKITDVTKDHGDLIVQGIGLKIVNLAVYGESYGTERGEVDLGITLAVNTEVKIDIEHDPVNQIMKWYVNGVLKGVQTTTAKIPSAPMNAYTGLNLSITNGATAAAATVYISQPKLIMEV